jgi:hypothetical protein
MTVNPDSLGPVTVRAHISAAGAPGAAPALAGAIARGLAVLGVGASRAQALFLCSAEAGEP